MISTTDVKLGFRMLREFPGLTIAGGLALAIAIGIGAGWYDFSQDPFTPGSFYPDGDRLVEIEVRDSLAFRVEQRMLFDFAGWRRDARTVERLSAYRTIERTVTREGCVSSRRASPRRRRRRSAWPACRRSSAAHSLTPTNSATHSRSFSSAISSGSGCSMAAPTQSGRSWRWERRKRSSSA